MTKEQKTNEFIHVGMVSSYLQLVGGKGYGEIIEIQNKRNLLIIISVMKMDGCI